MNVGAKANMLFMAFSFTFGFGIGYRERGRGLAGTELEGRNKGNSDRTGRCL